jgi:hypothetical protein
MRLSQTPPGLLSLLFGLLSNPGTVNAGPYPKDELHDLGFGALQDRGCVGYCGVYNQVCCSIAGEGCFTTPSLGTPIAFCSQTAAGAAVTGGYAVYTTTYTETDLVLRTSTYTSSWDNEVPTTTYDWVAPTTTAPAICTSSLGQSSCGTICCASDQTCAFSNSCTAAYTTSAYSAPLRPTSGGVSTQTSTVSATTTAPFIPPVSASGSSIPITVGSPSHGLSGGAIAGIVIGVIAGILLLILFCFCCILKAGIDGILAIFGLGKRKRRSTERVEVIEERYSRHGSGTASRRDTHTGWFGGAGGRPTRVTETRKKNSSGLGGLGMVGAGLLGLAAVLGLKRRADNKKEKRPRSDVSSTYYTDSFTGTSASK